MENGWCGLPELTHLEDPGKKIRVFLHNTTRDRVELAITSDQLLKTESEHLELHELNVMH